VSKFHSIYSTIAQESSFGRKGRILGKKYAPETSYRTLSENLGQYPTEIFSLTFVHGFGHILLVGCPIDPIFSATFVILRGSFLYCWLVCSSHFYSILTLGIELRT
jgi:hypothetical protein